MTKPALTRTLAAFGAALALTLTVPAYAGGTTARVVAATPDRRRVPQPDRSPRRAPRATPPPRSTAHRPTTAG